MRRKGPALHVCGSRTRGQRWTCIPHASYLFTSSYYYVECVLSCEVQVHGPRKASLHAEWVQQRVFSGPPSSLSIVALCCSTEVSNPEETLQPTPLRAPRTPPGHSLGLEAHPAVCSPSEKRPRRAELRLMGEDTWGIRIQNRVKKGRRGLWT